MIPLRPHHLLCMQFFEGKGYSADFVQNMTEVIQQLQTRPCKMVLSADVLCKACPNLKDGVCSTEEKVDKYDQLVLDLLHLSGGQSLSLTDCSQTLHSMDLSAVLQQICPDCQWQSLCQSKV